VYPKLYRKDMTLKEILTVLYELGMSTIDLCDATKGETCNVTIASKMKKLGIPLRGKGGTHSIKVIPMTRQEYESNLNKVLAKRHGVCISTICNFAKRMGWPIKGPGGK